MPDLPETPPTDAVTRRPWKRALLRPVGTVILLVLLFWLVPLRTVMGTLGRLTLPIGLAAMSAYLSLHSLSAVKLAMVLQATGGALPARATVHAYFAGLFGNVLVPGVIGGDAVTIAVGLRHTRSRAGLVLGCMACRLIDLFSLLVLAGISVLFLPRTGHHVGDRIFIGLFITAALGLFAAWMGLRWVRGRLSRRKLRKLVSVRRSVRLLRQRPMLPAIAFLLSLAAQAGFVVINAHLGEACGLHLPPSVWMFAVLMAKLAAFVPLGQAGIGVREVAFAALLYPFGVAKEQAVPISLVWQSIVIAGALFGGLIFVAARPRSTPS